MAIGTFTNSSKRVHKNVQKRYKIFKPRLLVPCTGGSVIAELRRPEGMMHVETYETCVVLSCL